MSSICFDIGANKGQYALANADKYAKIVCFEANPELIPTLQSNLQHLSNVKVVHSMISKNPATFYVCKTGHTLSTCDTEWITNSRFVGERHQYVPVNNIPSLSLDDCIAQEGFPNHIKIDVEGYEFNVLTSLSTLVPSISFEWAEEKQVELLKSLDYLANLGYTEFAIQYNDDYTYMPESFISFSEIKEICLALNPNRKSLWGMIWCRYKQI